MEGGSSLGRKTFILRWETSIYGGKNYSLGVGGGGGGGESQSSPPLYQTLLIIHKCITLMTVKIYRAPIIKVSNKIIIQFS